MILRRKRQLCKCKRLIPMEDRLSALPEEILCHILSFLSTKQAAATSVLSKRWNSLWLSVSTLELVIKNGLLGLKILNSVILLRDIKLPIQTLRLKSNVRSKRILNNKYPCRLTCIGRIGRLRPYYDLNPVIKAAIQRGLETLEIGWYWVQLASNIFSCKTLTVLKLWDVVIEMKDFPRINISPLKILHLDHVDFSCHKDMINFLLFFPTLEELQTAGAYNFTPQTDRINKCLPNLMRATISESKNIPFFLLSKAIILNIELTWSLLMRIEHTWSQVPTFHNLTKIELFFKYDNKKNWEWMLEMLQWCPKLQHLIIEQGKSDDDVDNGHEPDVVPECLSSQLRTCLIRNCRARKCELQFAEYVMRNSQVLRTMTIHCSGYIVDLKEKFQALQKLSLCPRS